MTTFYPHLTATGPAPPAREVAEAYRQYFYKRVAEGTLRPMVLPYHLYGLGILVIYLCIDHRKRPNLYRARLIVLAAIGAFQWKTLWETSSASLATSFVVGLISAWGFVWSATWLVFYKPQFHSKRIEFSQGVLKNSDSKEQRFQSLIPRNDRAYNRQLRSEADRQANGHMDGAAVRSSGGMNELPVPDDQSDVEIYSPIPTGPQSKEKPINIQQPCCTYYWQSYPEYLSRRIPWILDHLANFRGPGWNWAIRNLPQNPPRIERMLQGLTTASWNEKKTANISKPGLKQFDTRRELFWAVVPRFMIGYFLLDITKTFMMKDPYFIFGPTTYDLPPYLRNVPSWAADKVHEVISFLAIILGLEMVFMLSPICFCLILGPKVLDLRGEAWQYPTQFGSFSSNVMHRGLVGLWGGWWHQFFRSIFTAPTTFLIENNYVDGKARITQFLNLISAFGISGLLHAAGSFSQLPNTRPWHLFQFFMLQGLGVWMQTSIEVFSYRKRYYKNLLFTTVWLLITGWLLADDFARGGIWLFEPVPISLLRGLGFGDEGDGWWCWGHVGVGWYTGKHWWESGIAL